MTEDSVAGDKRFFPTDAQMHTVLRRIMKLYEALEQKGGTRLDPDWIAEALQALREGRIEILPLAPIKTVTMEWEDWSDLFRVPIEALGFRRSIYDRLKQLKILTVGLLTSFSAKGIVNVGVHFGPHLKPAFMERLTEHKLQFAADNSNVPLEYFIQRGGNHALYPWWSEDDQRRFIAALELRTVGDLARLSAAQVANAPFGAQTMTLGGMERSIPMSGTNADDVTSVVQSINELLHRMGFAPIS